MWVPLVQSILPKTLLKWVTPHSKRRAIKFKTKNFNSLSNKSSASIITTTATTSSSVTTTAAANNTATITNTTVIKKLITRKLTTISKQYHSALSSWLSSSSSSSSSLITFILYIVSSSSVSSSSCSFLIAQLFLLRIVIKKLSFLMNDFRMKSLYTTSSTRATVATAKIVAKNLTFSAISSSIAATVAAALSSSSSSSPNIAAAAVAGTIDLKLFNNNYKQNNHRTYNNSGKSNKVFLHYTPRDPRLRILSNQDLCNKHLESASELKITEDLCNYGELIGGGFNKSIHNKNTLNNNNNSKNYNSTNKSDSDKLNKIIYCDYIDSNNIVVESEIANQQKEKKKKILFNTENIKILLSYFKRFQIESVTTNKVKYTAGILL